MIGLFNKKAADEEAKKSDGALDAELLEACHNWANNLGVGDVPPVVAIFDALKAGADPNAAASSGQTPLLMICNKRGGASIAQELIARGAWVNAGMADGDMPLLRAAAAGDEDMMRLLLENDAGIHAQKTEKGKWPGAPDLRLGVHHFIVCNPLGESDAQKEPRRNCMKMILDRGLPVPRDEHFFIYLAKPHLHPLFPGMAEARELEHAVEQSDVAAAKEILAKGVKPDIAADFGADQALFTAATMGNTEMIDLLIAAGADIDLISPQNNLTPLQRAAWAGQTEAFDHLLDLGADPHKLGAGTGDTILSVAKAGGPAMEAHAIASLAQRSVTAQQPIAVQRPLQFGKKAPT
jgi:ankyrin repeat protein